MAVDLPLDFDVLLAPVSAAAPGGNPGAFLELRPKLEDLRREVTPETRQFDEEDIKTADWAGIEKLTRDALASTAKDLRLAGYLIEALVKRCRFDGLAAGLELIRRLFAECWDFLLPAVEDGDLSSRTLPVENMLGAPDRGLRLPTAVRSVPVVRTEGKDAGVFSFLDWMRTQDSKEKDRAELAEEFAKTMEAMTPEVIVRDAAAIDSCLAALGHLTKTMEERIGPEAPTLQGLREALEDCRRLAGFVLQKIGPARPVGEEKTDTPPSDDTSSPTALGSLSAASGRGASRDNLYQQLDSLAVQLQKLEPHSPIPYLIRRAVKLGAMPFPDLIRALVRDAGVLGELTREFGLPEQTQ